MKAVILAGGVGVRLRPFTFSIPKPLLPIGEKPILEIIIERLKKFGFEELILAVGYKSKMVQTYFEDGRDYGLKIRYLIEKEPRGTAGPLAMLRDGFDLRKDESVLLMNGDVLTSLDFNKMLEFHNQNNLEITVGVKNMKVQKAYGIVQLNGKTIKGIAEKPSNKQAISTGIYIVKQTALGDVPADSFFTMPNLVNKLVEGNRPVGAYMIKEFWLGMEDLRHFEDVYNNKTIKKKIFS